MSCHLELRQVFIFTLSAIPVTFYHSTGCVSGQELTLSEEDWVENPHGGIVMFASHSGRADKWANLLKTIFISLRSETHLKEKKRSLPVHFYHTEKAPKASATPQDQTDLHKERHHWPLIAAQASHLLRQSHVCQPWQ